MVMNELQCLVIKHDLLNVMSPSYQEMAQTCAKFVVSTSGLDEVHLFTWM